MSFRQIGRAATTDTRPTVNAPLREERRNIYSASPSVPSKFAKVPYSPPRQASSFGSSSERFGRTSADVNPGPGYYLTSKVSSLVRQSNSVSRNGLGNGFTSKSIRFRKMPLDKINFPAPGQYSQAPATKTFDGRRRAVTAASFKSRSARCNYMDAFKTHAPAPGTYELKKPRQKKKKVTASSFKSKSKRCNYMDEMIRDAPAPGAYDPKIPADFRKSNIRYAAFRSKGPRLPEWGTAVPGPGEYDPVKPNMRNTKFKASTGGSSSFANTNTDRWGTPYERKVVVEDPSPGPGAYTPAYIKQKAKRTTSSWAKSSVLRGVQPQKDPPPGPSYYSTGGKIGKRSFHLNVSGSFL